MNISGPLPRRSVSCNLHAAGFPQIQGNTHCLTAPEFLAKSLVAFQLDSIAGKENSRGIIALQLQNPRHHGQGSNEMKNNYQAPVTEKESKKIHSKVFAGVQGAVFSKKAPWHIRDRYFISHRV